MPTHQTPTAREIIGTQADDDYILQPENHAPQLPKEAAGLARALGSEEIKAVMDKYRLADRRALRFQTTYKLLGRGAIGLQAIGTIIGALFIVIPFSDPSDPWAAGLSMTELVAILVAVAAGGVASASDVFRKWNEARATAEVARVEFFSRLVSSSTEPATGELALLPLQLEYFRRYQLQIQKAYYHRRGAQHLQAHKSQRGWIIGFATLTLGLLAVSANQSFDLGLPIGFLPNERSVFIGLVIATLAAAIGSWSLLSQNEQNAKRYAATYANLEKIEADYLESAREAAEAGNREGVLSFVDSVNDLVSLEHRQWVYLQEIAAQPDIGPFGVIRVPKLRRRSQSK
jgi:hypothetical protein